MSNYVRNAVYYVFVLFVMGMNGSAVFAFSGGPLDGRTGSPADSGKTCNDTGCHNTYTLNSGAATFSVSAPSNYTLGNVNVTVSFSNSSTAKHGFELSALDAGNNHVGTFSNVDGNTQTSDGNYIKHTSAGSSQSGNANWNVQWTAPTSEVQDPVTFYAAGNEANGDGSPLGDYIYTKTAQISKAVATPTAETTPSPTPVATPTAVASCEPDTLSFSDPSGAKKLSLKYGESKTVTVAVTGADDCKPSGATVTVKVKTGKDRVTVNPSSGKTNSDGQASFTITGGQKNGNAKVVFSVKNSEGKVFSSFIMVKVRKK